jgi:histidinol-phosphate aminotransferase
VGYAVAHEPVAQALRKTAVPFGVSTIAQQAAIASLAVFDELQERVDALVAERERVVAGLSFQGWHVIETQANFVWLPLGADTLAFAAAAERAGLVVRAFPGEGARCTIAETEANDLLLQVARDFVVARTF